MPAGLCKSTSRSKTEGELGPDYDKLLALEVAKVLVGRPEVQQIVVSSFSLTVIDAVVAYSPGLATGLLVEVAEDPFRGTRDCPRSWLRRPCTRSSSVWTKPC